MFPYIFSSGVFSFFLYTGYESTGNRKAVKDIIKFISAKYVTSRHCFHCALFLHKMSDNVMRIFSFVLAASLLPIQANFNVW